MVHLLLFCAHTHKISQTRLVNRRLRGNLPCTGVANNCHLCCATICLLDQLHATTIPSVPYKQTPSCGGLGYDGHLNPLLLLAVTNFLLINSNLLQLNAL